MCAESTRIGRIYKIIVSSSNEVYVGSTFEELRHRWQRHKRRYFSYLNGTDEGYSALNLFDKYGIKNCKIMLVKEYDVVDRLHLEVYESIWIMKLRSINKNIPFSIKLLSRKFNYLQNKEERCKYSREYHENNKEKRCKYSREYHENNREERCKYSREYHEKNCKVKYTCECGSLITQGSKNRHETTIKHTNFVSHRTNSLCPGAPRRRRAAIA